MTTKITAKIALELAAHEGLVREAYKDSVGVWTWSIGITTRSGHKVYPRYKDSPATLKRCLEVYEWVLRTNYLPRVLKEFRGITLSEAELGGALSFHYNTGAIGRALWVEQWKDGKREQARESILNWKTPIEILKRRRKEQELFFDGTWSSDGKCDEFDVKKPSYAPDWGSGRRVSIRKEMEEILG